MQLLSEITVHNLHGHAVIQLLQGDLSTLPEEHAADILVMSAFPGEYIGLKGSLILALQEQGLYVKDLAADKESDLRKQLNCWLSKPLSESDQKKFNFKRILCFEPGEKIKQPEEVIGDIFRCINTFAFDEDKNDLIMPVIATGYQKISLQKILPALLQAARFWLQNGLPIRSLKLVVYRTEQVKEALPIFEYFADIMQPAKENKAAVEKDDRSIDEPEETYLPESGGAEEETDVSPVEESAPQPVKEGFDYFLSYAHVHAKDVQYFVDELKNQNNKLQVFYDKDSIPPGGLWIQQISAAIQKADKVLVFLSPDYDMSPVCWDEFQCAKLMEYNRRKSIIQTIYLYGHKETEMPPIMGIYSYIDCREGNAAKMKACIKRLLQQ